MGRSKKMKAEKRKITDEVTNMGIEFELVNLNDTMEEFLEK